LSKLKKARRGRENLERGKSEKFLLGGFALSEGKGFEKEARLGWPRKYRSEGKKKGRSNGLPREGRGKSVKKKKKSI